MLFCYAVERHESHLMSFY
uniref:Uncharacterized protein n=1 Tax=Rhizophora mucronata TaxID=61149 RepID=A0A2P2P697_RHIMU